MEREKLIKEYEATLESLVEKTKFVYSEAFYALDEFEKQKYTKDKLATEGHLGTLCNLLWGKTPFANGGMSDLFALGIIGSMFGGNSCGFPSSSTLSGKDFLKTELKDADFEETKDDN